ncbi:hypothetical protein AAON49_06750 [Pseudotenacibaculum sp. MALMAid0570]|uniref:hypothetical protein n=1 Tax=Pseudotenacibaculum sp. MALMAid0570 TaxID=3143938 RepID=UPI0032DF2230
MGLGSFSNISNKYPKIKVHINNDGEIVTIEREENGSWKKDSKLTTLFDQLPRLLNIKKKAIITIIQ